MLNTRVFAGVVFASAVFIRVPSAHAQATCPQWDASFPGSQPAWNAVYPRAFLSHDFGAGPELYAAYVSSAGFGTLSGFPSFGLGGVLRWNGTDWAPMGSQALGKTCLAVFDVGNGPEILVGGRVGVSRWNGTDWVAVGALDTLVYDLEVIDLGSGPELYACGQAPTFPDQCIVRWDPAAPTGWQAIGAGLRMVTTLEPFDDGTGRKLFAGSYVSTTASLARLDAGGWTTILGPGYQVNDLRAHDDGSGMALYAAGIFGYVGAPSLQAVVRLVSGQMQTVGFGIRPNYASNQYAGFALATFDDDNDGTSDLFLCGELYGNAFVLTPGVAKWDGTAWSPMGLGLEPWHYLSCAWTLDVVEFGPGDRRLFVGGTFEQAGGQPAYHVADWKACTDTGVSMCAGDGSGGACPCSAGSIGHGCANSVSAAGGLLRAVGIADITNDTAVLLATDMPNSSALYFQGTSDLGGGNGIAFGDGLRCAAGTIVRLATRANSGGTSMFPSAGDPPVSVRGLVPAGGGTRIYQVWYRNAASYCTSATWNLTNAVRIVW